MKKEVLKRYLSNRYSEEDLKEVVKWVDTEALSDEGKAWGKEEWQTLPKEGDSKEKEILIRLLDKIHHKINLNHKNYGKVKKPIIQITNFLTKAAAILFIPLLGYMFYYMTEKHRESLMYSQAAVDSIEVVTPLGSRTEFKLSDGSKVYLNSGSKIKYPQVFTGKTRGVNLIGEGFFEVAHNAEKPFIVNAKGLSVRVLGTKFNVMAYPDDNVIETTLVEGKVELDQQVGGRIKKIGSMIPGQHVKFNDKRGIVSSNMVDVEKYIAWKEGKLVFQNESITDVAKALERMFNVNIIVDDKVKDFTYTVVLVDEPLFQILDLMSIATPVKYKVLKRNKLPDGTFSKQTVIIEKR